MHICPEHAEDTMPVVSPLRNAFGFVFLPAYSHRWAWWVRIQLASMNLAASSWTVLRKLASYLTSWWYFSAVVFPVQPQQLPSAGSSQCSGCLHGCSLLPAKPCPLTTAQWRYQSTRDRIEYVCSKTWVCCSIRCGILDASYLGS